jgi:hypothetical protein
MYTYTYKTECPTHTPLQPCTSDKNIAKQKCRTLRKNISFHVVKCAQDTSCDNKQLLMPQKFIRVSLEDSWNIDRGVSTVETASAAS